MTEPLVEVRLTEISIPFWLTPPVTPLMLILPVAKIVLLTVTPTAAGPKVAKFAVVVLINPETGVQFAPAQPYELSNST